jgi:RNA polymerase sigma-70 factor, ECF subfamily
MAASRRPDEAPSDAQTAFLESVVEQYGKATYNFSLRLTGNEADARDLTQDAFVRVYRAWRSFKPGTSFLSWIYRIVTNLHRDELRRHKGRYLVELPEENDSRALSAATLTETPIDDYVERQFSEPIARALDGLSTEQRRIVVLADIEECSYQEIATIVGCSVGTVRSRLHRARTQLRKLIDRHMKTSTS